jgi:hypothetical protein
LPCRNALMAHSVQQFALDKLALCDCIGP